MTEYWRHVIGVMSAGILGTGFAIAVLVGLFAWFNAIADGDEGAIFIACIIGGFLLLCGAAWGLS